MWGEITSDQNVAALREDIFLLGDNMLLVNLQYISTQNSLRILFIKQEGQTLVTLFRYHTQLENILHVILIKVSSQLLCDHSSWKVVCSIIKQQFPKCGSGLRGLSSCDSEV